MCAILLVMSIWQEAVICAACLDLREVLNKVFYRNHIVYLFLTNGSTKYNVCKLWQLPQPENMKIHGLII